MVFRDLKFSTPVGAQTTLCHLKDTVKKDGYVTVEDFYHYLGYSTVPYHDAGHWGWDDLSDAYVTRGPRDACYISLPKMKELNTDEWIFQ